MINTTSSSYIETAETGWASDPIIFGDYSNPQARIFAYATNNSGTNGNWNTNCGSGAPCFTQTASGTYFGDSWANYSTQGGTQYYSYTYFVIYEGNVWLNVVGGFIGYYAGSGYTYMASSGAGGGSQLLEWGGEVETASSQQAWTATVMGSGAFANNVDDAAWMSGVQYMASWGTNDNTSGTVFIDDANCYTAENDGTDFMLFGGIGWASGGNCP